MTFLSAVGSEFVEMYAGVAAARVNSLYHSARKKARAAARACRGAAAWNTRAAVRIRPQRTCSQP